MAGSTLDLFLGSDNLTKLAAGMTNRFGVPKPLPAPFYDAKDNPNVGMEVAYDITSASREAAPITNPSSPPIIVDPVQARTMRQVGIGSAAKHVISPELIERLGFGGIGAQNARREIERQVENFVKTFDTLKANMVHSAVFRGRIDIVNNNGFPAISPTTTPPDGTGDRIRTIDYGGTPTANVLTVDGANGTYNFGDWSNPNFDIVSAITGIQQNATRRYGFPLTHFYYGSAIPGQLAANTSFQKFLQYNPQFNQGYVSTGQIPNGTLGFTWVPVATAVNFLNRQPYPWVSTTFKMLSPPPEDTSWYELFQCGLQMPAIASGGVEIGNPLAMDADQIAAAFPVRYGLHSWAQWDRDVVAYALVVRSFMLATVKSPNAVFRTM